LAKKLNETPKKNSTSNQKNALKQSQLGTGVEIKSGYGLTVEGEN
jgi:hypothetical protein